MVVRRYFLVKLRVAGLGDEWNIMRNKGQENIGGRRLEDYSKGLITKTKMEGVNIGVWVIKEK
jgi:hypothetical protein